MKAGAALRREPQYTPDVSLDFLRQTSPANPYFKHAEAAFFLAKRDGRVVGRVCAAVDAHSNAHHQEKIVNFGFFEVDTRDADAAAALLDAAARFGRERGMTAMRGPVDLNMNYKIGILLNCYDSPPAVMMNWNPPEYVNLMEKCGMAKEKDVLAMEIHESQLEVNRYEKLAKRVLERGGLRIREFDMKYYDRELELVRTIFNKAWENNWGFTPAGREDFAYEARGLRDIINPKLGCFIEKGSETVAFSLSIPDVAIGIREIRGRLLPFGWYKLLKRIKTIRRARMILLGILPEHRKSGLDAILYLETTRRGQACNMSEAEFGWLLEDNEAIIKGCEASGAKVTKRYRIYRKEL